jgi:nicotinate-nucleotide adenylyltransferase
VNIALFGGTFDPIHSGHLQAARDASRRFRLGQVLFIPTGNPPHKYRDRLSPFAQRFAMVALACAEDKRFIPSLLEAPTPDGAPKYSVDTVRAAKRLLRPGDRLFFIIGLDAFLDLPHWKEYRRLLGLVNFIVVPRPGFRLHGIRQVVPPDLLLKARASIGSDTLRFRHSTVHILRGVDVPVASRDIRRAIRAGRGVAGLVPPLVEQYIRKEGLYRPRLGGKLRER